MRRIEVNPGDEYGDLEVIREVDAGVQGKRRFLCKCFCGNEVVVRLDHLRSGHSTSCGQCGIVYNGQQKTLKEWAESAGLNESTLRARLKVMDISEAMQR